MSFLSLLEFTSGDDTCSPPFPPPSIWRSLIYVQYATVGLSVLTIPFYALVIAVLLRNLKRIRNNHAFFIFFLVNSAFDLLSIVFNVFGTSFPAWGLFLDFYLRQGTFIGKITLVVSYWARYAQAVNTLLIAFNRSTAVLFPFRYEKIWSRKWVRVCVLVQIFIGAPLGIMVASNSYFWRLSCSVSNTWDLDYVRREPSGMQVLVIIFDDENFKKVVLAFSFSAEAIIFVVLVINYTFMLHTMRNQRILTSRSVPAVTRSSHDGTIREKQNFMLLRMAIVICLVELCYAMFGVASMTFSLPTDQFHFFYNLMTTVYSSMGPYLLVGFSATTRRLILSTLLPKRVLLDKTPLFQVTNTSRAPAGK